MNLAAWAELNGVARVTAYRWFRAGLLPMPARRVGRLILVEEPAMQAGLLACARSMRGCPPLIRMLIWTDRWRG
jgi:predicted site-specific integrase-resolvase